MTETIRFETNGRRGRHSAFGGHVIIDGMTLPTVTAEQARIPADLAARLRAQTDARMAARKAKRN